MSTLPKIKAAFLVGTAAFFTSCSAIESRPYKQMAYAESAHQAALQAGADSNSDTLAVFQLAKDQLARARSYYRLKNFREARVLAVKSRRLSEEAEWKALKGNSGSNSPETLIK